MFTLPKKKVETFDFKIEGQRGTYKVPLLKHLNMDQMIAAQELTDADDLETMVFVKAIFDEYAPGIAGGLTGEEFGELARAYFEASGATMGE